jgi:hypothetical protein
MAVIDEVIVVVEPGRRVVEPLSRGAVVAGDSAVPLLETLRAKSGARR